MAFSASLLATVPRRSGQTGPWHFCHDSDAIPAIPSFLLSFFSLYRNLCPGCTEPGTELADSHGLHAWRAGAVQRPRRRTRVPAIVPVSLKSSSTRSARCFSSPAQPLPPPFAPVSTSCLTSSLWSQVLPTRMMSPARQPSSRRGHSRALGVAAVTAGRPRS